MTGTGHEHKPGTGLPIQAIAEATRVRIRPGRAAAFSHSTLLQQAQRDGMFAGLSSGLVSGQYLLHLPVLESIPFVYRVRTLRIVSAELLSLHLAILGSKLFRLDRKATILCGLGKLTFRTQPTRHSDRPPRRRPSLRRSMLTTPPCVLPVTGILSGYQFTQGFLATNMARLEAEQAKLDKLAADRDAQNTL